MPYNLSLPTTTTANGIWTLDQAVYYQESNSWPITPCSPTIGNITSISGTSINVAFTAPSYNGSAAITGYSVTSNTGTYANGTISPITVTGLANGTSYTFIVQAKNSVGTGKPSAVSAANTTFKVPNAPTIGAVSSTYNTCNCSFVASVAFTASTCSGGTAITSYTATSCPGGYTGTGASSPVSVSGLGVSSTYTFKVKAQNSVGFGPCSSASAANTTPALPPGSHLYSTAGTYTWVAPPGLSSVSVVAVGGGASGAGGGGGKGGMLRYVNNISVTPGTGYTVGVGAGGTAALFQGIRNGCCSYFLNTSTLLARGGRKPACVGGNYYTGAVGTGGCGGGIVGATNEGGGSGAGGYSGDGGRGGFHCYYGAFSGSGGAGAGGAPGRTANNVAGGGGGGVGMFGQGANGYVNNRDTCSGAGGGGGSGGTSGQTGYSYSYNACNPTNAHGGYGGNYGGGGGGACGYGSYPIGGNGGSGAVRVVWPGSSRTFPTTCVGTP